MRVSFFFSKHENGFFREPKLIDEQVFHAFGIVNAPLELVPRVSVRYSADHGALPAVRARRLPGRSMIVRRGRRRRMGGRGRGRPGVGDVGDRLADGAADGSGSRRQLQRDVAPGAVHEHHRRRWIH